MELFSAFDIKEKSSMDKSLKEQILEVFPDAEFGHHESDLYVKVQPGLREWLKSNYQFYTNITGFVSQIDKKPWLSIPFANQDFWDRKLSS